MLQLGEGAGGRAPARARVLLLLLEREVAALVASARARTRAALHAGTTPACNIQHTHLRNNINILLSINQNNAVEHCGFPLTPATKCVTKTIRTDYWIWNGHGTTVLTLKRYSN